MSAPNLVLRVPDPADCAALGFSLERLLALDKAAAVRIVGIGPVAAVYSAPPLHGSTSKGAAVAVLAVRTLALAPGSEPFDRTVAAGRLLDALAKHGGLAKSEGAAGAGSGALAAGDADAAEAGVVEAGAAGEGISEGADVLAVNGSGGTDRDTSSGIDSSGSSSSSGGGLAVPVPEPLVGGPSWAGLLPPRTGWRPLDPIPVARLADAVAQGNADFRFAALGRDRAGLDALAEEIWTRELPGGLRWRSAHAASAMGFLGPDPAHSEALARLATHARWLRLDAPYGTVLERTVLERTAGLE